MRTLLILSLLVLAGCAIDNDRWNAAMDAGALDIDVQNGPGVPQWYQPRPGAPVPVYIVPQRQVPPPYYAPPPVPYRSPYSYPPPRRY